MALNAQLNVAKVIIGSTLKELSDYRTAVVEALFRRGLEVLIGEQEKPASLTAVEDSLALMAQADLFIGMLGLRYGYVPRTNNPGNQSLLEIQIRAAQRRNLPIVMFLANESIPLRKTGLLIPTGEMTTIYRQKLLDLRKEVQSWPLTYHFASLQELQATLETLLNQVTVVPTAPHPPVEMFKPADVAIQTALLRPHEPEPTPTLDAVQPDDSGDNETGAGLQTTSVEAPADVVSSAPVTHEPAAEPLPITIAPPPADQPSEAEPPMLVTQDIFEAASVVVTPPLETPVEIPPPAVITPEGILPVQAEIDQAPAEASIQNASVAQDVEDSEPAAIAQQTVEPTIEPHVVAVADVPSTPGSEDAFTPPPITITYSVESPAETPPLPEPDFEQRPKLRGATAPLPDLEFEMDVAVVESPHPDEVSTAVFSIEELEAATNLPETAQLVRDRAQTNLLPRDRVDPKAAEMMAQLDMLLEQSEPPLDFPPITGVVSGELVTAPALCARHPVPEPARLFGRQTDVEALNDWYHSSDPLMIIQSPGGTGKTTLAWYWLRTLDQPELKGRFWWSFLESGGNFRNFIRYLLAYLTGQMLDAIEEIPHSVREQQVLSALTDRPFAVALDGIEILLPSLAAPHLTEAQIEALSHNEPEFSEAHIGSFFRRLVSCTASKTVLVTRVMPAGMRAPLSRNLLPGIRAIHLSGLPSYDGVALLTELSVHGTPNMIAEFLEKGNANPLFLRLLAGYITHYAPARGQFDQWHHDEVNKFQLDDPLGNRIDLSVRSIVDRLPSDLAMLLAQIAAFPHSVGVEALDIANPFVAPRPDQRVAEPRRWQSDYAEAKIAYDTYRNALRAHERNRAAARPRLDAALHGLMDRELVQRNPFNGRLSTHPVVQAVIFSRMNSDGRKAALRHVRDYYDSLPPDDPTTAIDLEDLERSIALYQAMIGARLYDEAALVYRASLDRAPLAKISSQTRVVELLIPFFPEGIGSVPPLTSARERAHFANELAVALGSIGQRTAAARQLGAAFGPYLEDKNPAHLCAALLNYAGLLRDDSQLADKAKVFELARELAEVSKEYESLALARLFLLKIYADTGQWALANRMYNEFSAHPPKLRTAYRRATAERMFAKMQVYQRQDPTNALNLALELAIQSGSVHEQLAVYALWGELGLQQHRADAAEKFFRTAIKMANSIGVPTENYVGGLARSLVALGRLDDARALLPHGISRAAAAEVLFALGEYDQAYQAAQDAYRAAWGDGPPFSYWMELDLAKRTLNSLGLKPPLLAPFNPLSLKPMPYEVEIYMYIQTLKAQAPIETEKNQ